MADTVTGETGGRAIHHLTGADYQMAEKSLEVQLERVKEFLKAGCGLYKSVNAKQEGFANSHRCVSFRDPTGCSVQGKGERQPP